MAKLTYNEIFTNVKKYDETGSYTGLQIASKLNQKNGQDYKLIDAIDIDWNGVWSKAAQAYLNDTYELIQTIDNLADIADLEFVKEQLNDLREDVDLIFSTYVTQNDLSEILSHYEHAIEAGEHIIIDENNIIKTYDLVSTEEAYATFTTIEDFDKYKEYIYTNYYDKDGTFEVAYSVSIDNINRYIIKNADERFNDLEKVSNWILEQPEDISGGLDDVNVRLNRLDEVVGYSIYDDINNSYTYTGMIYDVNELQEKQQLLIRDVQYAVDTADSALSISLDAIAKSDSAYEMAYYAYEVALESGDLSLQAYEMAYYSVITVGHKHSYAYFTELTQEDIEILQENPTAFEIYAIRPDNHSGVPIIEHYYDPEYDGQYYKYIPEVESTGFYKSLEDVEILAYEAKYSADNALFRLFTRTSGTSYIDLNLTPDTNDGTNIRFLNLDVEEANIDSYTGEVTQEGIITNSSLSYALSYISTFVVIPCKEDEDEDNS